MTNDSPKKYKFSSLKGAPLPKRGETYTYDLNAKSIEEVSFEDGFKIYKVTTDLSVEIPDGHVGLICPKFSLAQQGIIVFNSPNILHNGKIENIQVLLNRWDEALLSKAIAQLVVIVPYYPFDESE